MGHGTWDRKSYESDTLKKLEDGTNHDYSRRMMATQPRSAWKVNELLDPKRENQDGDHKGTIIRESLDFEEHPDTTPIVVVFDVTGSMHLVPNVIQRKLPELMKTLVTAGVPDPQILVGAVGDAYSDSLPIQIGQFESDNRIDQQIDAITLEAGGGGGNHESYELMAYFLAEYTHMDSFELRGKKGFCFFIGDERVYDKVDNRQVEQHIGQKMEEGNLDTRDVFETLKEKFNVFFLMSEHGGYTAGQVVPESVAQAGSYSRAGCLGWDSLVDKEQILVMSNAEQVCDKIAEIVAVREGERVEA